MVEAVRPPSGNILDLSDNMMRPFNGDEETGSDNEERAVEENRAAWPGFGLLKPLIPGG